MIQCGTFSSPHNGMVFCCGSVVLCMLIKQLYSLIGNRSLSFDSFALEGQSRHPNWFSYVLTGKAFVIFKLKATADMVISQLNAKCLMLADGRYLVAFCVV